VLEILSPVDSAVLNYDRPAGHAQHYGMVRQYVAQVNVVEWAVAPEARLRACNSTVKRFQCSRCSCVAAQTELA
jgi:hypothetical protein